MNENHHRLWQLTDLLCWTPRDIEGHSVGRIADVTIDPAEGRVAYLHILVDGTASFPDLQVSVPWSAISRISDVRRDVRIAARKDTLIRLGLRGGSR